LLLGAIGYFALTGEMAEMFGWENEKLSYHKQTILRRFL